MKGKNFHHLGFDLFADYSSDVEDKVFTDSNGVVVRAFDVIEHNGEYWIATDNQVGGYGAFCRPLELDNTAFIHRATPSKQCDCKTVLKPHHLKEFGGEWIIRGNAAESLEIRVGLWCDALNIDPLSESIISAGVHIRS